MPPLINILYTYRTELDVYTNASSFLKQTDRPNPVAPTFHFRRFEHVARVFMIFIVTLDKTDSAYPSKCAVLFGFYSTEHLTTSNYTVIGVGGGGGSYPGSARTSAGTSLASSRESSCASCPGITQPFRIAMVGAAGVGKTSLVCQFMTSESLHIYDASIGEYAAGQTSSTIVFSCTTPISEKTHLCIRLS